MKGSQLRIETGVRYNHRKIYRLIGDDLYSAAVNKPLKQQVYVLEKAGVVGDEQKKRTWRVVVRAGMVWLEDTL